MPFVDRSSNKYVVQLVDGSLALDPSEHRFPTFQEARRAAQRKAKHQARRTIKWGVPYNIIETRIDAKQYQWSCVWSDENGVEHQTLLLVLRVSPNPSDTTIV